MPSTRKTARIAATRMSATKRSKTKVVEEDEETLDFHETEPIPRTTIRGPKRGSKIFSSSPNPKKRARQADLEVELDSSDSDDLSISRNPASSSRLSTVPINEIDSSSKVMTASSIGLKPSLPNNTNGNRTNLDSLTRLCNLSIYEIDVIASYLEDLDVLFWWACGDQEMNKLIEGTTTIRIGFPPACSRKWPPSFLSRFKSLLSLSLNSVPYSSPQWMSWESMPKTLRRLRIDGHDPLEDCCGLASILPYLEVFIATGCSRADFLHLHPLPPNLHTLSLEFRYIKQDRDQLEVDRHASTLYPVLFLLEHPLPPSLTYLKLVGESFLVHSSTPLPSEDEPLPLEVDDDEPDAKPDVIPEGGIHVKWPPHLQELNLHMKSSQLFGMLPKLPPSLSVLHLRLVQDQWDVSDSSSLWSSIPMSVTDLELDLTDMYDSIPPRIEHLRSTYRRLRVISYHDDDDSPITDEEFWKAMPMIESAGNDMEAANNISLHHLAKCTVSEAKDVTYFPRLLDYVEFLDGMTLDTVSTVLEQSKKLRTIVLPQELTFDLSTASLSFPDSLTSLQTPHGLDLFKISKSLRHLHLLKTSNNESNSILPPRLDSSPLLLPFHLETLSADVWSFRFVKNGFRVLPSTLRKLVLADAEKPEKIDFTDNLHCIDLPTSLTSLHVETDNNMSSWCGEIPGSPNLSASLRELKLVCSVKPLNRIEFAVWTPPINRHIPFPYLTSLTTPIWHVDAKYWENFPRRILHLNVTCFEDSYSHFTGEFLYGFDYILTVEIDNWDKSAPALAFGRKTEAQGGDRRIRLWPYQGFVRM